MGSIDGKTLANKIVKFIKENTDYEVIDNRYLIAYKSVREDYRSVYLPNHYR